MLSQHAPLILVMSFASHSGKSSSKGLTQKEQRCGVAMDTVYNGVVLPWIQYTMCGVAMDTVCNATVICRHLVSFNFLFVHGLGTRLVVEQRNLIEESQECSDSLQSRRFMSSLEFMDPCQTSEGMGHNYMSWRWRHFSIWNTSRQIGEGGEGPLREFLNDRTKMMVACARKTKLTRDRGFLKMKIFGHPLVSGHLLVRQQWCQ